MPSNATGTCAGDSQPVLLLMRHAKSSWDDPDLEDHDRPLNKRGKRDAPRMGRLLLDQGLGPDLIVTSSAIRARRTGELVAETCGDPPLQIEPDLYHAGPEEILEVIAALAGPRRLLVVGHNPGLEELVSMIADEWTRMPTAAIACATVRPGTKEFALQHLMLNGIWRPRELP
jgi:phosphohistidine phosphatase